VADRGPGREVGQGASLDVALAGRLCRLSVDLLGADASWTLLEDRARDVFVRVAGQGLDVDWHPCRTAAGPGPTGVARPVIHELLSRLEEDGVAEDVSPLVGADPPVRALCMGLRQAEGVVGVQVAVRRRRFAPGALRLAQLIADLGSVGLANQALRSQLERAWHASTEYLANASHGLRTPLNVILGYAEIARDPAVDGEEQERCVDLIARYAGALASAVDALCRASHVLLPPHAVLGPEASSRAGTNGTPGASAATSEESSPAPRCRPLRAAETTVRDLPWGTLRATTKGARRVYHDSVATGVAAAATAGTPPRRPL